jgi:hypothetical protein
MPESAPARRSRLGGFRSSQVATLLLPGSRIRGDPGTSCNKRPEPPPLSLPPRLTADVPEFAESKEAAAGLPTPAALSCGAAACWPR